MSVAGRSARATPPRAPVAGKQGACATRDFVTHVVSRVVLSMLSIVRNVVWRHARRAGVRVNIARKWFARCTLYGAGFVGLTRARSMAGRALLVARILAWSIVSNACRVAIPSVVLTGFAVIVAESTTVTVVCRPLTSALCVLACPRGAW